MLPVIDRTFDSPADNLSFDESLFASGYEALRFWESRVPFVVMGRSGRPEEEVNVDACAAAGVPVLRRSSGGGTVLQGPGCLNYCLSLSLEDRIALADIPKSYEILLSEIARVLRLTGLQVRCTDILLHGRKVSGSAQRRTRGWLLHHGTLLCGMDPGMIERFLPEPRRQPPHRERMTHREFLGVLPLAAEEIKKRIATMSFSPTKGSKVNELSLP